MGACGYLRLHYSWKENLKHEKNINFAVSIVAGKLQVATR